MLILVGELTGALSYKKDTVESPFKGSGPLHLHTLSMSKIATVLAGYKNVVMYEVKTLLYI